MIKIVIVTVREDDGNIFKALCAGACGYLLKNTPRETGNRHRLAPKRGAPRIHGEIRKLGFWVSESTVARYMIKRRGRPTQNWKTSPAPRFLIRDRDRIFGSEVQQAFEIRGIEQLVSAPRSPWQNGYCERVVGTLKRECLNHMIVLGENHTRRVLKRYLKYYHGARTHIGLEKDTPDHRPVEPPCLGPGCPPGGRIMLIGVRVLGSNG